MILRLEHRYPTWCTHISVPDYPAGFVADKIFAVTIYHISFIV